MDRLLPMYETPRGIAELCAEMTSRAPYCGLGFRKVKLAPEIRDRLQRQLRDNTQRFRAENETDYIQTECPGTVPSLFYEDRDFNAALSRELHGLHEDWAGMELEESACYGIRVYQRGSYLYNHVDHTETHIISSTICVDSRLEKRWPLAVVDIEGTVHQVDIEPGELLFFEGAKLTHGRPYPLVGDFYASIFVHYRPTVLPPGAAARLP